MYISVSSVIFNIPFMFPDPKDLRASLNKMLFKEWDCPKKYEEKFGAANLDFIVILNQKTKELEIKGPTSDEELVYFTIWLPHKKIKFSSN